MLPGFRFLFAAIVLSMSILVFGLGAAALLRSAHEAFASNPSWHAPPETTFAQQNEPTRPVLAMRVEPLPAEQKAFDSVPVAEAPPEPAAIAATPAEPERIAALKPEEPSLPETAKPEIPLADNPIQSEAAPAAADAPAAASETRIAATEQVLPPTNEAAPAASEPVASEPVASEQLSAPASPEADIASTKIATLGGPPVTVETQPPAEAASAKPDTGAIEKRLRARRAAQRRRIAQRARLAQQAAQQPANPFAQPAIPVRSR
jgi:hypothetical protein